MSIAVSQAFRRTSANAVDETLTLTKAEMLAVNDNLMPSKYLTVCQDDGLIYLYDKSNTVDSTTGKFRVFESGGGGHEIEDDSGTALTQRETMQFGDGFNVSDDSTNEKTVVEPNLMTSADMDDVVTPLPGTFARYHEYSTTEQVVGKWIDGSTIYEKTITGNTLPTGIVDGTFSSILIDPSVTNLDRILFIDGFIANNTTSRLPINGTLATTGTSTYDLGAFANSSNTIVVACNKASLSGYNIFLILQYTKTT